MNRSKSQTPHQDLLHTVKHQHYPTNIPYPSPSFPNNQKAFSQHHHNKMLLPTPQQRYNAISGVPEIVSNGSITPTKKPYIKQASTHLYNKDKENVYQQSNNCGNRVSLSNNFVVVQGVYKYGE